jgi:hypothetical protein
MFLLSFLLSVINIYSIKKFLQLVINKISSINWLNKQMIIEFENYLEDLNEDIFTESVNSQDPLSKKLSFPNKTVLKKQIFSEGHHLNDLD